ncbi:MAG: hypothetical protein WBL63_13800 [Candidatus Acidiferrum sp.]
MNKTSGSLLLATVLATAVLAFSLKSGLAQSSSDTAQIEGLVRDIACPLQNTKSTTTSFSKDCILECAKAGSPLGILTADGTTYLPITTSMPDRGQEQLKPFIGELVQARGKLFERNGGHAIEIKEIHKLPPAPAEK